MTTAFKRERPLEQDQELTRSRQKRGPKYRSRGRLRVPKAVVRVQRMAAGRMGGYARAKALTRSGRSTIARIAQRARLRQPTDS